MSHTESLVTNEAEVQILAAVVNGGLALLTVRLLQVILGPQFEGFFTLKAVVEGGVGEGGEHGFKGGLAGGAVGADGGQLDLLATQ